MQNLSSMERAEDPVTSRVPDVSQKRAVGIAVPHEDAPHAERQLAGLGYTAIALQGYRESGAEPVAALIDFNCDPDLELVKNLADLMPVVLIAAEPDFEMRLAAARAGVQAIVSRPVDPVVLGAWLAEFDRSESPKPRILIVDDDELSGSAYAMALESADMEVDLCTQAAETVQRVAAFAPDLVLMDLDMPHADGVEVAKILRQSRQNLSLPIVFLSAERDSRRQQVARRIGGDDFIAKPVDLDYFAENVAMRVGRARELRQMMDQDSMTGLLNHARFIERLAAEIDRSRRTGSPISVGLIDLDHFKGVNDRYGHQAGDEVIRTLAHSLIGGLRRTDIVARYGGEEFGVILLDTPPDHARRVMDKIREAFGRVAFESMGIGFSVTLSAGVSGNMSGLNAESVLEAADQALYRAKQSGRNRVVTVE